MQLKKSQETEPRVGRRLLTHCGLFRAGKKWALTFLETNETRKKKKKVILELKIWVWGVGGGSGKREISSWLEETSGEVPEMRGRAGDAPGAGRAHWGEQESRSEGRSREQLRCVTNAAPEPLRAALCSVTRDTAVSHPCHSPLRSALPSKALGLCSARTGR